MRKVEIGTSAAPFVVVDSVTDLTSDDFGAVAVTGSHGGSYSGMFALSVPVSAAVFSDAGRGRDDAGVAGLELMQQAGVPAAAASVFTARIGSGEDVHARGLVSVVNERAAGLGVHVGQTVRDAIRIMRAFAGAPPRSASGSVPVERRRRVTATPVSVWVLDSASLAGPGDDGAIVITGSHGGAPGGDPERALKCTAALAAFNDAGVGKDHAGTSRLSLLQSRGIPAVTVDASSARIGDGTSTLDDGVISAMNSAAAGLGASQGQRLADLVDDLLGRYAVSPRHPVSMLDQAKGTRNVKKTLTGGRAVAEMVKLYEPGPIFGMGGFQMLPFYEGARDLGLKHVLINDERTGAFAANAYANLTGRPGLCDGTLGPGATNLVTGLVESFNAGVPIIAFVGEQDRNHAWKNMTQETRQQEILSPVCKEYLRVERISRIPELVRRAFYLATSGRPGPVVLAVPEDVAHEEAEFDSLDFWADERAIRVPAWRSRAESAAVAEAVALLTTAERPIILNGGGIHASEAYEELLAFARALNAPVAHTLTGKGGVVCSDPLSVGVFGRYSRYANELIEGADAIVAVGCKLGEIATKRYTIPRQDIPLIHLDVEPDEIGHWSKVAVGLWGDARETLRDLAAGVAETGEAPARTELWDEVARRREEWAKESGPKYDSEESPIHMARLIGELNKALPADATLIADGGFASHWTGLLFDTKEPGKRYLTDRGFASIGYGVPGALGAKLARPGSPVVAITGDGGFNMSVGDLETARRENLEFVVVIVNNAASGYVKALQHAMYGPGRYESSDLSDMDYSKVAEAYGCLGIRVDEPAELEGALRTAMAERGRPVVIDVSVTRDPSKMLPAVDSRTLKVEAGDRPA